MWADETDPNAYREALVQVDAHRVHVTLARHVRVRDVRLATAGSASERQLACYQILSVQTARRVQAEDPAAASLRKR